MLRMRDISAWNGVPDIKSLNAEIIAVKCTEGTGYLSPAFAEDWENVRHAGKKRMAYHFFHPSISAIAQVRFFLDNVKGVSLLDGDTLALDHESTDGMEAPAVAAAAVNFRAALEKETKCKLIIYTFRNFAWTGNCEGLGDSPLWIADPSHPAGHPEVPLPWHRWDFHQYGVTRGIDDDLANFETVAEYEKLAVLPTPPPLTEHQRRIQLTDGKMVKETIINLDNFLPGFQMDAGDATFKVL